MEMKRTIFIGMVALMMLIASCHNGNQSSQSTNDDDQTQLEINEASSNDCVAYRDSVEKEYQYLISELPQYKDELNKEKAVWEKYTDAVHEVARCEDRGSSTPMYVNDVVNQGTCLWSESLHNMCLHLQGGDVSFSKTRFTPAMIADAYDAYIKAVGEDEDVEDAPGYQDALRKEQKCWNDWMKCRAEVSRKLTAELRAVYDGCTNQVMRTKLLQLKNQNKALGLISGDIMEHVLPDDCSDKELLEYPGFDKVWAEYMKGFSFDTSTKPDSFTVIYRQPVNGYKVSAVVKQDKSDMLSADLIFTKNAKTFTLYTQSFGDTLFNRGWEGVLGENDELMQKYRNQTIDADYHENRKNGETMPRCTPFFFQDLDFDGIKELVVVHFTCAVREHSGYDVYRIVEGEPVFMDEPPYNDDVNDDFGMTDYPEFDFKKKTISCPYPEGELKYKGRIIYGVSKMKKDTVIVNVHRHLFNHMEIIKKIKY